LIAFDLASKEKNYFGFLNNSTSFCKRSVSLFSLSALSILSACVSNAATVQYHFFYLILYAQSICIIAICPLKVLVALFTVPTLDAINTFCKLLPLQ